MAETKTRDEVDIDTEFNFISPGMYKVVVQNDDHTPMDFVIALMMHIFKHNEERAKELTIQIHEQGSAVAGVYTYEVAEQKGVESTMLARQNGWPLAVRVEEE
jgi:ATP-dependent Clp protease adaptor protein ClpS